MKGWQKALLGTVLGLVVLSGIGAGVAWWQLQQVLHVPTAQTAAVVYEVPKGATLAQVSRDLHAHGWLRHPKALPLLVKMEEGLSAPIHHGRHELTRGMTPRDILLALQQPGQVELTKFVIPEGFTLRQIADRLQNAGVIRDAARFLTLATDLSRLPNPNLRDLHGPSLEGYLFPDTYAVPAPMEEEAVIELLVGRLWEGWEKDPLLSTIQEPWRQHEVLTLASIVEREARLDEERTTVAGLYANRLERNMLLQCDATVQYALPTYKKRVLNEDLKVQSPYNTYLYPGLPPGPIGSPGLASLRAAANPDDHDYLYMVARPDGGHVFSRSQREHNAAVRVYRHQVRRGEFGDLSGR